MIKELIEKAEKEKKLVSINTDFLESDEALVGFITSFKKNVILTEIDEFGNSIGKTSFNIENILTIDFNDRYLKRLDFLINKEYVFDKKNHIYRHGSEWLLVLKELCESKKIATFFFDNGNYVIGKIFKFDNNYIIIENIGVEGDEDGISAHSISMLESLRIDGLEEQKIDFLYLNRHLFY